jgi:hypothetical protein
LVAYAAMGSSRAILPPAAAARQNLTLTTLEIRYIFIER